MITLPTAERVRVAESAAGHWSSFIATMDAPVLKNLAVKGQLVSIKGLAGTGTLPRLIAVGLRSLLYAC